MYPLKFKPVFQERIWGGSRLAKVLGKALPAELTGKPVGESWELADLPPGTVKADSAGAAQDGSLSSVINNGPWRGRTLHEVLAENRHNGDGHPIMGQAKWNNGRFPLLVKFLDAQADLSVQVHPDAAYCVANPSSHLKSEAWYIVYAEPGAKVFKGLQPGVTRNDFRAALQSGQVEPLLKSFKVRAGDCHYLESGTVHALGAGILAAEVQTPSDTTFRVFDWNRLGPDGKPRKLHVEEALATIDFEPSSAEKISADAGDWAGSPPRTHVSDGHMAVTRLVTCDYFALDRVHMPSSVEQEILYAEPVIWIILDGQGVIQCASDDGIAASPTAFCKGDTLLLPASLASAKLRTLTDCTWLEAKLPGAEV